MVTRDATVRALASEQAVSTPDRVPLGTGVRTVRSRRARRSTAQPAPAAKTNGKGGYTFKQLGRDIRLVRERRGLSQQAVAKKMGVPQSTIADLEDGRSKVAVHDLSRLARIFGCTIAGIFESDAESHMVDLTAALHRALPKLQRAKGIESEIMRILLACHDGVIMRGFLGQPAIPAIPMYPSTANSASDAITQGETAARMERGRLEVGAMPIANIPGLFNNIGIWSLATKLPDGLSGLSLCHQTVGLAILVNRELGADRRNLSYAHEYAHAIFDREEPVMATRNMGDSIPREIRANAFSTAFLMPPDGVALQLMRMGKGPPLRRRVTGHDVAGDKPYDMKIRPRPGSQTITPHDISTLARHFCVSEEVMIWRLQNLGHINPKERDALSERTNLGKEYVTLLDAKRPSGASARHDNNESEFRHQVMRLTFEAYRSAGITGGRVREVARNLSLDDFPLANLAGELYRND